MSQNNTHLIINTTDSRSTVIEIHRGGERFTYTEETNPSTKSQNVLPFIEKVLRKQGLRLTELAGIKVHPGPGSFTGTRVGVAVANALGWVLGVPVNGKKIELPKYGESKFD